jgi:glycerophosphoryl diester phosphodiesterase
MAFSFLAREAGRVHVCGHRGYSLRYPENTLPAFAAAMAWGATTIEIDIVLTAEGEPIVLHDRTLGRTTDGHGFAADFALEQIRGLDAGARFNPRFAGTRVPALAEVVDWAAGEEIGIFLDDRVGRYDRLDEALEEAEEMLLAVHESTRGNRQSLAAWLQEALGSHEFAKNFVLT